MNFVRERFCSFASFVCVVGDGSSVINIINLPLSGGRGFASGNKPEFPFPPPTSFYSILTLGLKKGLAGLLSISNFSNSRLLNVGRDKSAFEFAPSQCWEGQKRLATTHGRAV